MQESDFCEAQLQQLVNTEMFNLIRARYGINAFPWIIPPHLEDLWGWDSAFCLPWLGPGHAQQNGCNLFLQYKLSTRYDTPKALGWDAWRQPFLRFNLGYQRDHQWDFSQRDHLIALSNSGFFVAYITNHVLDAMQLFAFAGNNQLCATLPVLQVSNVLANHERVTFVQNSAHFVLRSEPKEYQRVVID